MSSYERAGGRGNRYGSTTSNRSHSDYGDDDTEDERMASGVFRDASYDDEDDAKNDEDYEMSLSELLYSSSSYYAIVKPVTLTMVLASLVVVFVNTEETIQAGAQQMADAYQIWKVNDSSGGRAFVLSLANSLVMVSVICGMTFVIVLLYRFRCMKCLVGYMISCSAMLLGVLGGNIAQVAIIIYNIPVDNLSFLFFMYNFAVVGVLAVFWEKGIPKIVTQGYLVATSVILAWHLDHFDPWTAWSLLLMLALYDLCAVLTPCGPLRFLVELMSKEDSPNMPGLLFEAELPPEARRPGVPTTSQASSTHSTPQRSTSSSRPLSPSSEDSVASGDEDDPIMDDRSEAGPVLIDIPLAIARVYDLPVVAIPSQSITILNHRRRSFTGRNASAPLLADDLDGPIVPENPTVPQLKAAVTVSLPASGGRIEPVVRQGKKMFVERDRHGNVRRTLWLDRNGKVFAELRDDEGDDEGRNSIRLGLGDFIFYSVLVAKAAQYSFTTFCACILVILAGLGGTLVLLSVYHHALPALPISIFLGVVFYVVTRVFIEPWIEAVFEKPLYV